MADELAAGRPEIHVTADALHRALERAAEYRRRNSKPHWNGNANLAERISWQRRAEPVTLPDGWFVIGVVLDELVEPPTALAVWWQPATDAVRVQRPRPFVPMAETPPPRLFDEPNPFIR